MQHTLDKIKLRLQTHRAWQVLEANITQVRQQDAAAPPGLWPEDVSLLTTYLDSLPHFNLTQHQVWQANLMMHTRCQVGRVSFVDGSIQDG